MEGFQESLTKRLFADTSWVFDVVNFSPAVAEVFGECLTSGLWRVSRTLIFSS